jgi:CheY-like chemotaxis protein
MGKKILLADDSITIQKVIELTFSDEDFEVVTVGNGRLAVERLEEVRPDIVLCDIIMPEKDGYEVCDYIKKHPALGHVPVLLLTGAFEPFDQERASRVGCDGFLAKPFEPQALIAKVKDLLAQAASRPAPRPAAPPPPPVPEAAPPAVPQWPTMTIPTVVPAAGFAPATPVFAPEPPAPAMAAPPEEPAVTFMPEEAIVEEAPPGTFDQPMDLAHEPGMPPPPYAPAAIEQDLYPAEEPVEAAPDEFMPLMADEPAAPAPPALPPPAPPPIPESPPPVGMAGAEPEEDDGSSTVVFRAGEAPIWSPPTEEVPLEARAQAGVQSQGAAVSQPEPAAPVFDEVEEAAAPEPPAFAALAPPPPAPAAFEPAAFEPDFGEPTLPPQPAPAPVSFTPPPAFIPPPPVAVAPAPVPEEVSFEDVAPPAMAAPAAAPVLASAAAEVTVPVDQVAQIAQRVVAQISERVVREIAWEVIPDLAEALIKKEIERLKAELERT